jgi:hypothetical protein
VKKRSGPRKRGWRLGLSLLLLAALSLAGWALMDYPCLTAAGAFRRGLRDAGLPEVELELVENGVGVGTDGSSCYLVRLEQRLGWHWSDAWSVPGAEGLIYAPLDWKTTGGYHYKWEEQVLPFAEDFHYAPMDFYAPCFPNVLEDRMPAFAVRAEGADARLSLRLEPQEDGSYRWGSEQPWQGGSYSLVLLDRRDGWFIFGFDPATFRGDRRDSNWAYSDWARDEESSWTGSYEDLELPKYSEPVASFVDWIRNYRPGCPQLRCPAVLYLQCFDENGSFLRTATWEP